MKYLSQPILDSRAESVRSKDMFLFNALFSNLKSPFDKQFK